MDTFVVRLWSPGVPDEGPDGVSGLHGTAHHVASGQSAPFRSGLQLLSLLADLRGASDDTPDSPNHTDDTTATTKEHPA